MASVAAPGLQKAPAVGWEEILTPLSQFLDELLLAPRPEAWFTPDRARRLQGWLDAADAALEREPSRRGLEGPELVHSPRYEYRLLLGRLQPALENLYERLQMEAARLESERRHAEAVHTWCEHQPAAQRWAAPERERLFVPPGQD